jgi:phosphatidylglycerol:prolipoprotein diacylglycerol transferase
MLYICLYYFSMQAHFQFNDFESALVFNGAFIAGTLAAMYLQFREGKRKAYPLATWVTVIAVFNGLLVAGSRLGGFSLADWATLFGKGIFPPHAEKTVMGGLLLALPVYFIVKRWWKLPAGAIDSIVLGLPLAAFFCRIGCLFSGCCFGELTHGAWGLCYAPGTSAYAWQLSRGLIQPGADTALPVHPVQLYFILSNCLTFCILYVNRDRFRRAGSLALAGLSLLMLFRFGHEFFREATTNRGEFGLILVGLKTVQWVCLAIGIGSLVSLYIREKQKKWRIRNQMDFTGASLVHD